jgi:hypothetical protein
MAEPIAAIADVPPSVGPNPSTAPVPPMNEALMNFSDILFEAKDSLGDGLYKRVQDAARQLYEAKRAAPAPSAMSSGLDRVSSMLVDLQNESEDYKEQLTQATVTMDRLRERRDYYAKTSSALKGVLVSSKIPDKKLLEAYERVGIKQQVLRERERKRKRDQGEEPIEVPIVIVEDESDED